jgi:3D (Asp-Asp-Asp) domain-containing protein
MLFTEISPSSTPYGLGTSGACGEQRGRFRLVPHRSIAVDKTGALVPYGTVLYIERLRGAEIELPSGRKVQHDGYVQAVDTGGAIQGIHFDYFKGPSESDRPLQQLISSAESLVDVRVVSDPTITQTLCDYHLIPPAVAG